MTPVDILALVIFNVPLFSWGWRRCCGAWRVASGQLPHQNLERWLSLAVRVKNWLSSQFQLHLLLADFATDRLRIQTGKSTTVSYPPRSSWLRAFPSPPPALDWPASQCCSPTRPTPTLQSSLVLAPFYPSSPLPPPSSFTLSARSMLPSSTITRWVNHFCPGLGCGETNCVFYHPRWKTSILRWCTTSC